jgi:hypothetical protein
MAATGASLPVADASAAAWDIGSVAGNVAAALLSPSSAAQDIAGPRMKRPSVSPIVILLIAVSFPTGRLSAFVITIAFIPYDKKIGTRSSIGSWEGPGCARLSLPEPALSSGAEQLPYLARESVPLLGSEKGLYLKRELSMLTKARNWL